MRCVSDETEWGKMVEVDNVMSLSFSCLRQWMLPSLLRVEAASSRAFYPHRLFEAGDVAVPDRTHELGSRTETVSGAVMAHATAHFSEIHSCLDVLFYHLGKEYSLEPVQHPSFLEGRAGRILSLANPSALSVKSTRKCSNSGRSPSQSWPSTSTSLTSLRTSEVESDGLSLSAPVDFSLGNNREDVSRLGRRRRKLLFGESHQFFKTGSVLDGHIREHFPIQ